MTFAPDPPPGKEYDLSAGIPSLWPKEIELWARDQEACRRANAEAQKALSEQKGDKAP